MKLSTWCPVTCPAKRWRTSRALPDPDTSRKTTAPTILRQPGGQARKHRYSNLSLIRKNNCSLRATQTLTASTNTRSKRAQNRLTPPTSSLAWTPHSEASAKHKGQPDLPEAEAAKSPSRSPKCCKPTQWRQLTHKEILRGKQHPKTQHRWTARKTHDDMQECYKPKPTCSRRSPHPTLVFRNPTALQGPHAKGKHEEPRVVLDPPSRTHSTDWSSRSTGRYPQPMLSSPLLPLSKQCLSERFQPQGNNTSN